MAKARVKKNPKSHGKLYFFAKSNPKHDYIFYNLSTFTQNKSKEQIYTNFWLKKAY